MASLASHPEAFRLMRLALDEAKKCIATATAFCVGAVIVAQSESASLSSPTIISTGYSRELPGNTHAEACAIDKLFASHPETASSLLAGSDIYTTLEPCSVRLSGNRPCVDRLIEAKIGRCFVGVQEPTDFVECEGTRKLKEAGIEVWLVHGEGLAEECLAEARRAH